MPKSVLEAVKLGFWDFEPAEVASGQYDATDAMPGTREKVEILAQRLIGGLPLWHPDDRFDLDQAPAMRRAR